MSTFSKIEPYIPENMSAELKSRYGELCDYLDNNIEFSHKDSEIHTKLHSARVMLYARMLANAIIPEDAESMEILAHAALFHDTQRYDDGLDTGHGARAAVHYADFCPQNKIPFHPESAIIMKYHDLDDSLGIKAMGKQYPDPERVKRLYAIFKDADALDRYRLGPDGLDSKYLRNAEAVSLMPFAEQLVSFTSE